MKKFAAFALALAVALPMGATNAIAMDNAQSYNKKLAKKGKKVAIKQCFACHDITKKKQIKVGPPLWGVYGKNPGHAEGYQYSDAHLSKKDAITWDAATLDAYMQDPKALIPGNKMVYPIPGQKKMSDKQRGYVIEFLKSLK